MSALPRSPAIAASPTPCASARSTAESTTWLCSQYANTAPSGGSALTTVPSGMTRSTARIAPDVNQPSGSKRYLNATPTVVLASSGVALMQVRACREVPPKSTSARPPRFVTVTRTRYSSSSPAASQSIRSSPTQVPSGIAASAVDIRSAAASQA